MSKLTTGRAMAFERLLSEDAIMLPQYRKMGGRGIALAKALNRPFEFERSDTAYSKTLDFLPSNWKGAAVESIGGKTAVWNQLVDTGTSSVTLTSGHKYYTLVSGTASIVTGSGAAISVTGGTDKVCDLTLMFGSGNEPSTVEQFRAMFPTIDPAYNAGELISAGVTSIVSKDAENATLATLPIPAAVQSLPGYGWSAGSVCNEVDWANKKYIQRVGSVDLGTLSWTYAAAQQRFIVTMPSDYRRPVTGEDRLELVNPFYTPSYSPVQGTLVDKTMSGYTNDQSIYINDFAYTDASTIKTAMSGVPLRYVLATSTETDISSLLSDDNLLPVEPGGTLTFENQLGDGYRIPVPTKVKYQRRGE